MYPAAQPPRRSSRKDSHMPPSLDKEIRALELSIEGLLKLLGGSPEERERFWEIFKGITSVAEHSFARATLVGVDAEIAGLNKNLAAAHAAARQVER